MAVRTRKFAIFITISAENDWNIDITFLFFKFYYFAPKNDYLYYDTTVVPKTAVSYPN